MKIQNQISKIILLLIAILVVIFWQPTALAVPGRVEQIQDADTFMVNTGLLSDVRVACIDAPETAKNKIDRAKTDQASLSQFKWGAIAKKRLEELVIQSNNRVDVIGLSTPTTYKRNFDRNIASVTLADGSDLAYILVKEGLSLVYEPYVKDCEASILRAAQDSAIAARRGVHSDPSFIPPWKWRSEN